MLGDFVSTDGSGDRIDGGTFVHTITGVATGSMLVKLFGFLTHPRHPKRLIP